MKKLTLTAVAIYVAYFGLVTPVFADDNDNGNAWGQSEEHERGNSLAAGGGSNTACAANPQNCSDNPHQQPEYTGAAGFGTGYTREQAHDGGIGDIMGNGND